MPWSSSIQSSAGDQQLARFERPMIGKLCYSWQRGKDDEDLLVCKCVCGCPSDWECMVDGSGMLWQLILLFL